MTRATPALPAPHDRDLAPLGGSHKRRSPRSSEVRRTMHLDYLTVWPDRLQMVLSPTGAVDEGRHVLSQTLAHT